MQSRKHTIIEVLLNIGTGFILSVLIQECVISPLYHLPTSAVDSMNITLLFTVTSIIRSYIFRRLFNRIGRPK